jgi:hypothetical protein
MIVPKSSSDCSKLLAVLPRRTTLFNQVRRLHRFYLTFAYCLVPHAFPDELSYSRLLPRASFLSLFHYCLMPHAFPRRDSFVHFGKICDLFTDTENFRHGQQ